MSTKKGKHIACLSLDEIYMHSINPDSKFGFLKASCTHTMKITDTYQAWIGAEKKGGKIASAFCTCVAE